MEKITIVCPHCFKSNSLPLQDSYAKANCGHCQKSLLNTTPVDLTKGNFGSFSLLFLK
jgi:thioredoxin 2